MVQAYKILSDSSVGSAKAGEIVFSLSGYDYGLASDDTNMTGIEHISVTRNRKGNYPSFTIPRDKLQPISMPPSENPLTEDHIASVCKLGKGAKTCRYLSMDAKGWDCLKNTTLSWQLDERVRKGVITAQGNNCEGKDRD